MALVDELTLHLKAGDGGDGVVRWRHEKYKEFSGPSGGNGGRVRRQPRRQPGLFY